METKPKIKIVLTTADVAMEIAGWAFICLTWGVAIYQFYTLPDSIPVHFNEYGYPDRYSHKGSLFLLPIIGIVLFVSLTWLNRYPHVFNYPVNITADNAELHYRFSTRMLRYMKMVIAFIFCYILIAGGLAATGKIKGLGWWFLPLVFLLTIVPSIYAVIRSFRLNK